MEIDHRGRWLRLVRAQEEAAGEGQLESQKGERETIFIVEDDPAMRGLLRQMLKSLEADIEEFSTAEGFLAACGERRRGCVLLDMRLPGGCEHRTGCTATSLCSLSLDPPSRPRWTQDRSVRVDGRETLTRPGGPLMLRLLVVLLPTIAVAAEPKTETMPPAAAAPSLDTASGDPASKAATAEQTGMSTSAARATSAGAVATPSVTADRAASTSASASPCPSASPSE